MSVIRKIQGFCFGFGLSLLIFLGVILEFMMLLMLAEKNPELTYLIIVITISLGAGIVMAYETGDDP